MGPSLSPLELLLPEGFALKALVIGGACPSVLSPSADVVSGENPVDLVVVAPTTDERRDPAWVESAANTAVTRLARDGIVYLVPARAKRLQRALVALGLKPAAAMLHVPDVPRSRHVVPVGTAAERYALSGHLDMNGLKRLAASAAMRSSWLSALGPTGTVHRRVRPAPLAAWLFAFDGSLNRADSVLLTTRRTRSGGTVLHRFVEGNSEPDAIAKVSSRTPDELRGLLEVAPAAARAGARVPEVLWSGRLGPSEAFVQSALAGASAARLVERGRLDPGELVAWLTRWLERWSREAARPRPLGQADLDRFVLAPARRLAVAKGAYLDYLAELCARAVGSSCPFVPTHGDLTATNVLVDPDDGLGILDWEEASAEGLPLTDFFYAAADAFAAVRGYSDRPAAVRACFAADGEHMPALRQTMRRLAAAVDLEEVVQEVCFHACWLHHASNEERRGPDPVELPFRSILGILRDDVGRFSTSLFGR